MRSGYRTIAQLSGVAMKISAIVGVVFLSSIGGVSAEARTNDGQASVSVASESLHRVLYDGGSSNDWSYSLLSAAVPRSAFERNHPPIAYVAIWPELPSVSEQMVKLASDRLRTLIEDKAKAERPPVHFDWDAFWETVAGCFILAGLCAFTIAGADFQRVKRKSI